MKLRLISEGEHKDAFGTHKWKTYAQIPTNADKIRSMTDEELAVMFAQRIECMYCPLDIIRECRDERTFNGCKKHWLDWLKQEAEDEQAKRT